MFLMEQMHALLYKPQIPWTAYGKSELREKPKINFTVEQSKGFIPECDGGTFMSDSRSERLYFPAQPAPGQAGSRSSRTAVSRLPPPG